MINYKIVGYYNLPDFSLNMSSKPDPVLCGKHGAKFGKLGTEFGKLVDSLKIFGP